MVLKFIVTAFRIVTETQEGCPTSTYTVMGMQRAPEERQEDWGHEQLTVRLKPADLDKFKLGQVLSFMSISAESPDQGGFDYEAKE